MNRSFQLLPEQGSAMAARVDALVLFLLAITVFFTLLILVLVSYFALRYRRHSTDFDSPNPPATQTNMALEVTWTLIPLLIVMVLFVWGARLFVEQSHPPAGAMEIHVIGRQWMWKIQHPDGRREINQLHDPGRPADQAGDDQRGRDPQLLHPRVPPDAGRRARPLQLRVVRGRPRSGEYHLFCREYCGTQHSGMIGSVRVLEAVRLRRLAGRPPRRRGHAGRGGRRTCSSSSVAPPATASTPRRSRASTTRRWTCS